MPENGHLFCVSHEGAGLVDLVGLVDLGAGGPVALEGNGGSWVSGFGMWDERPKQWPFCADRFSLISRRNLDGS